MGLPFEPEVSDLSPEQQAAEIELYGALTDAVRRLGEASLRTTISGTPIEEITAQLDSISDRLEAERIPGSFGVSFTAEGRSRAYGNAVVGLRNPIAVPLKIVWDADGKMHADFHLNALYEGPPATVHGGVVALLLDQVMGEAAAAGGKPGMTGTLSIRYGRNTPLGDCSAAAWIDRVEGVKTFVHGELRDVDGTVTVTAEGVFILPRWAREKLAEGGQPPQRFE